MGLFSVHDTKAIAAHKQAKNVDFFMVRLILYIIRCKGNKFRGEMRKEKGENFE
jgi:hypothetical protein